MARERAESEWADEHPEYDIESEDFPNHVFAMAHPIYLWDAGALTYEQLELQAPHRAYVVDVYSRLARLANVLRSLSVIEKMLSLDTFPLETPKGKIHREAWLRVTLDACLARVTAVRDCLFLLTASVLELNLKDRDINLRSLKKNVSRPEIVGLLEKIAATGRTTREERDLKFHRGVEREFDEEGLYHNISIIEMYGGFDGKVVRTGSDEPPRDLREVHERAVGAVRQEMRKNAMALIELALDLFDTLFDEYDARWAARRDRATDVRDWEKSS
jgi:hypothetical protein